MSLSCTELLSCDQAVGEGQQESPGKHRHWLANAGKLPPSDTSKIEDETFSTSPKGKFFILENNMLIGVIFYKGPKKRGQGERKRYGLLYQGERYA